ncbi:MAG: hypothetical protein HY774_04045 [Acidobacteria bacterium]|nr:hypothetical protein [Acidobacteriota bacterium]
MMHRHPYWIWPFPIPTAWRKAAGRFIDLAEPCCRHQRWIGTAILIGVLPVVGSYWLSVKGHQLISAILLTVVCLYSIRINAWPQGMATLALAYLFHSLVVILFSIHDPQGMALVLPDAEAYWKKSWAWIQTGYEPEYQLANWVPAHFLLLGAAIVFGYTSLGSIIFFQGFYEVDLMNYYNAQLIGVSTNRWLALVLGWHLWSILRGCGYLFITYEVTAWSFRQLTEATHPPDTSRRLRIAAGIGCLIADGLVKATLMECVRTHMFLNLKP